MMTVKDLMENGCQSSPDGKHWEPALPRPYGYWRNRLRDAWAVLNGKAIAIRQTTKADITKGQLCPPESLITAAIGLFILVAIIVLGVWMLNVMMDDLELDDEPQTIRGYTNKIERLERDGGSK